MKRILTICIAIAASVLAFAQTPEEILAKMEAALDQHENDGVSMVVDVKIPILGTMSTKTYALGEKFRVEAQAMGIGITTWSDEKNEWTYNSKTNEVEIKRLDPDKKSSEEGDLEMFENLTDGYDVALDKETDKAWYLHCKKSKSNTDKDAPKTMDVVVAKGTYLPLSLSAKMSGVSMTMHDFSFGVTEQQVTFDPKDYPGVKIIDKR